MKINWLKFWVHEVGHVIARHSAEQMSKQELSQGIAGAAGVAAGDANSAYLCTSCGEYGEYEIWS